MFLSLLIPIADVPCAVIITKSTRFYNARLHCEHKQKFVTIHQFWNINTNLPSRHWVYKWKFKFMYRTLLSKSKREIETCLVSSNWIKLFISPQLSFSLALSVLCFVFSNNKQRNVVQLTTVEIQMSRENKSEAYEMRVHLYMLIQLSNKRTSTSDYYLIFSNSRGKLTCRNNAKVHKLCAKKTKRRKKRRGKESAMCLQPVFLSVCVVMCFACTRIEMKAKTKKKAAIKRYLSDTLGNAVVVEIWEGKIE